MKKKILVRGPALSQSGYGEQCRFALRSLRSREDIFDIYLIATTWGKTSWIWENNEENEWINNLIEKTQQYIQTVQQQKQQPQFDLSLQVTIPNEFEIAFL